VEKKKEAKGEGEKEWKVKGRGRELENSSYGWSIVTIRLSSTVTEI